MDGNCQSKRQENTNTINIKKINMDETSRQSESLTNKGGKLLKPMKKASGCWGSRNMPPLIEESKEK